MNDLEWLDDAALGLREAIESEAPATPDLADVLARARCIDADAVPADLQDGTAGGPDEPDEDERHVPELAAFTDALQREVEADVERRGLEPTSPPRPASSRRSWVAVLAVAAAVLVAVGLATRDPASARLDPETAPLSMVAKTVEALEAEGAWERPKATPRPAPPRPQTPEVEPTPVESPEQVDTVAPTADAPTRAKPRLGLDELEQRAMAAWKAGELDRAESLLRKVIARAGKGTKAELAYGDLFALAKQRGGAGKQAKVWRQYLRKFPHGRHADDARAGLCMRASGEAASKCWTEYLAKHPSGAHATRAHRAID